MLLTPTGAAPSGLNTADTLLPVYLHGVPRRLPQDRLFDITPLTEEERRQRLISGQSLIEGPNEQPMGSGVVTSSLAMCPAEWVAAAMGTLRAESPDLDFRPGSIARALVGAAANGFTQDLRRYMEHNPTVRNPYQVPDAQTARLAQQIRAVEDEEIFRRLDEVARDGTWGQEHMGTPMPMPIRTELEVLAADPPREPLGFTVHEEVGTAVVNPRAIDRIQGRRVQMPMFEIAANPTIRLGDVRARRFPSFRDRSPDHPFILALIRTQQARSGCPCGCGASNQGHCWNTSMWALKKTDTGVRRTTWEWISEDVYDGGATVILEG